MSEVCVINPDNPTGNMYYRGDWAYCPEYKTGDVVKHEGVLYISLKHNAGKAPSEGSNREYWHEIVSGRPKESYVSGKREEIDGGYASSEPGDKYEGIIDGGSSSEREQERLM